MEGIYPLTPLASRKAPIVDGHRLFTINGAGRTAEQDTLLRDAKHIIKAIDHARGELLQALDQHDPDLCAAVCRRFLGIGLMLTDRAIAADESAGNFAAGGGSGSPSGGARGTGGTVSSPSAPEARS